MKRVLILTYYWPPSGGAGVQRWLKFVKYLREFGWEPIVYTAENPEAPADDDSLEKDIPQNLTILKTPIWEPYDLYKKFTGQASNDRVNAGFLHEKEKPAWSEKLSVWIRGNFFIPDARRFWIKPSIRFLQRYLKTCPVDAIVSTGPPHTMHMIGMGLKKNTGLPWIADFRDPWTQIDFYDQLHLTWWADAIHHRKEKKVLTRADKVVTVGNHIAKALHKLGAGNTEVIPNGYDDSDFKDIHPEVSDKFIIAHIGSMNRDRNIEAFWNALAALFSESEDFRQHSRLKLVGKTDISVKKSLKNHQLEPWTETITYVPHQEALRHAATASLLYLPLNNTPYVKGILTGKLFEYLAVGKPVLCVGPHDGDTAAVIEKTKSGKTFDFENQSGIMAFILASYQRWKAGETIPSDSREIAAYSRRNMTAQMAALLDDTIK